MLNLNQKPLYFTEYGKAFVIDSLNGLKNLPNNSVDLVITSPPFALLSPKEYGNKNQNEYIDWLTQFAIEVKRVLKDTGSFVIDLGGAYIKNRPVRSLYNYRVLIKFCDELGFNLAEEFFWYNPAKLPSPISWVNVNKIRVKDAVNTIWWLTKTDYPKADVKKVLNPYSESMKKLIQNKGKYLKKLNRPSGHNISKNIIKDNGGSIPSNLLQIANTSSGSDYLKICKLLSIKPHPARFPEKLPEFFIKFLTDENDIVVDIFAGSNVTGLVCEKLKRQWISMELSHLYLSTSIFRFTNDQNITSLKSIFDNLMSNLEANYKIEY